jgi:hypothetical protein
MGFYAFPYAIQYDYGMRGLYIALSRRVKALPSINWRIIISHILRHFIHRLKCYLAYYD